MSELLLGIDVGTSSVKAVATDTRGAIVATASRGYAVLAPRPGWSEQAPQDWWQATVQAIREVVSGGRAVAIALSGQMHGSVLIDRAAREARGAGDATLRPAILWNDQRTAVQCDRILHVMGGRDAAVRAMCNAPLPGFTLPKLLWVREHEPKVWESVAAWMLPKDYILFRLTGEHVTDVGDASGTLLFDIRKRRWSEKLLATFDIPPAITPRTLESGSPAGTITAWAAAQTGLPEGTPVIAGSGDNMMGALGAGIVETGMSLATIGTSGVIYSHAQQPLVDLPANAPAGRLHTMCGATGDDRSPGTWCVTGCTLSAGGALAWAKENLWPEVSYDQLLAEAARVSPGCDGLLFLPHLTGERCPYPDPSARGAWFGLTTRHTRGALVRAVLEGVAMTMAHMLELHRNLGITITRLRLGGGGARNALWRQILADAFGVEVRLTNTEEGPAFGAALLAGVHAGAWGSIADACRAVIRETDRIPPSRAGVYTDASRLLRGLYQDTKDAASSLATLS